MITTILAHYEDSKVAPVVDIDFIDENRISVLTLDNIQIIATKGQLKDIAEKINIAINGGE